MRTGFTNRPGIIFDITKLDRIFAEDLQDIADYINSDPTAGYLPLSGGKMAGDIDLDYYFLNHIGGMDLDYAFIQRAAITDDAIYWHSNLAQNKRYTLSGANISEGETRTINIPDKNGTIALLSDIPDVTVSMIDKLWQNIMLAFFKLSVVGGLAKFNLVDGFVDEYEDESGVDLVDSLNFAYDAVDKYFSPSAGGALGTNLISHFLMNDSAGNTTVLDNKSGYNGVAHRNTSVLSVSGRINNALDFNGSGDHVHVNTGYVFGNADFTISWWEYRTANAGCSIAHDDQTYSGFLLGFGGTGNEVYMTSSSGWDIASGRTIGNAVLNSWQHIVVTRSGNTFCTYRNNVLQDTWSSSGTIKAGSTYMLQMGRGQGGSYMTGKMDDVRVYSRCLTEDDRDALYNEGLGTESETTGAVQNLTLISNVVVAENEPSQARLVIFEEDIDAITLNTDIKAYVSIDDSTYTEITLTDEGDYETGKRILSGVSAISSSPGTSVKYKIQTFNSKYLHLYGCAVQWD